MNKLFWIFLGLLSFTGVLSTVAQQTYTVSGMVVNEKGETIPAATIFLSNTKRIVPTNEKGEFKLLQIPAGIYELIARTLGYESSTQSINVNKNITGLKVVLKENSISLTEVYIIGPPDPNRARYMQIFKEHFLGNSINAGKCKILNPEVLRFKFNKQDSVFEATSPELLVVENRGLGYVVRYQIDRFHLDFKNSVLSYFGSPYFEDLPGSVQEQNEWKINRKVAYEGSIRHFFKAAFNNTAEEEGFTLYDLPPPETLKKLTKAELDQLIPTKVSSLISEGKDGLKSIKNISKANSHSLYVVYSKEPESIEFLQSGQALRFPPKFLAKQTKQVSGFSAQVADILIDRNGMLNRGKNFSFKGYWAWERIPDLVPVDYSDLR